MYQRKTRTLPLSVKIPAFVILAASLFAMTEQFGIGLLFASVALLVLTMHDGIAIDFTSRRIRLYWSLLGIKFGKWEELPAVERITLVPVNHQYSAVRRGTGSTINTNSLLVVRYSLLVFP